MHISHLAFGFPALILALATASSRGLNIQPFAIKLTDRVPHMLDMIRRTQLPATEHPAFGGDQAGISLDALKSLRHDWANKFIWEKEQESMNA